MTMEFKITSLTSQSIDDRTVTGLAAVFGNIDDGGDVLQPGAFTKTLKENNTNSRVRHLWQHNFDQPPIAVITGLTEVPKSALPPDMLQQFPDAKGGLMVTRQYLNTPRGNEVLEGIKSGAIKEMSFAFDPVKVDYSTYEGKTVRNLREVKLYETSDVIWGMNPATRAAKGALFDLFSMITTGQEITALLQAAQGLTSADVDQISQAIMILAQLLIAADPDAAQFLDMDDGSDDDGPSGMMSANRSLNVRKAIRRIGRMFGNVSKGAIPFKKTPIAPIDSAWDAGEEVKEADVPALKIMCAWVDPEQADVKAGYKLPHHIADGENEAVWAGVAAAMGALMGAQGGVDIPDGDRKAVWEHLSKHYAQFKKTPPDFKMVELAHTVKQARTLLSRGVMFDGFKVGKRNSSDDESRIKGAMDALEQAMKMLQELLSDEAAEPTSDDMKSLTDAQLRLQQRLAIAKLNARKLQGD